MSDREKIFNLTSIARSALHGWLGDFKADAGAGDVQRFEELTGLYLFGNEERNEKLEGLKSDLKDGQWRYKLEVHSFRGAQRVARDGSPVNRVIVSITQKRIVPIEPGIDVSGVEEDADGCKPGTFVFRGGCTLVFDLSSMQLKYVVKKLIDDSDGRLKRQRAYRTSEGGASLRATYFGAQSENEPFALLHSDV